nr:substrate-binding domain-containing protein [Variovorax paradoxus]
MAKVSGSSLRIRQKIEGRGRERSAIASAHEDQFANCVAAAGACRGRIAVTGFGDMRIARAASPRLSTVRNRHAEMDERAYQMLLARLSGEDPVRGPWISVSK